MLLSEDNTPGCEAFLTDFEFAKLPPPSERDLVRIDTINKPMIVNMPGHRPVPADATNVHSVWHEETYKAGPEITVSSPLIYFHRWITITLIKGDSAIHVDWHAPEYHQMDE